MISLLQPVTRFVRRRRIPFPWLAAAVCLAFALAGYAVLDDYGVGVDEAHQRNIAFRNADYITGNGDALPTDQNRLYGLVFELPALMAERALRLEDSRDIFLLRHLLIHLFYIVGGFFCGLLVYRMFGSHWVALLAMLLFLLHPRLYAHSFFNSKDLPFAVMFIIGLYLTHRAFRRDTIGAFALLGVVIGLAVNLRLFALLLPAAVLAMRGLDWWFASNPLRRKRILATGGVFAAAVLFAIYASQPYYWENPLRFFDSVSTFSQFPLLALQLFQGRVVSSLDVPPEFVPVWFGITAPPVALLLGGVGALVVCWRGLRSPGLILRSGELRFLYVTLGCFVLPVAVAIVLEVNIYDRLRHFYFLWGPFCLLAAAGLHRLAGGHGGELSAARPWQRVRSKRQSSRGAVGGGNLRRIAVYGMAAAGLANIVYAIVSLHPHQQIYFNPLVNRAPADELGQRYGMGFVGSAYRQGIEHLLELYPDEVLYIHMAKYHRNIFPAGKRERLKNPVDRPPDFYFGGSRKRELRGMPDGPALYEARAYGSAYLTVTAPRMVWGAGPWPGEEAYRTAYQQVTAGQSPAAQSDFDIYVKDNTLYYVQDNCRPEDTEGRFFLHVFPAEDDSLPVHRREYGFDNRSFYFDWRGGFVDGKCLTQEPLPDYPITRITTGQWLEEEGRALWQAGINLDALSRLQGMEAVYDGFFELYRHGDKMVYYRESCAAADTQARFFLHLFPADNNDLPEGRLEHGFDNLGFNFSEYGAHRGGNCLAEVPLPNYQIARIRTGQYAAGEGQIWAADFLSGR